jgi:hypothetical protein
MNEPIHRPGDHEGYLTLSDVPFTELRIGQVVRFTSGKYAFICELVAEVPYRDAAMAENARAWYPFPRYSAVAFFTESGRVTEAFFQIGDLGTILLNRCLSEAEFFRFEAIVAAESQTWQGMPKTSAPMPWGEDAATDAALTREVEATRLWEARQARRG